MNDTDKKALLRRTTLLSASLAGVSFASWTTAQERDLATLELDALTVSARVWEEPVKEVPFSLSAFEEAALKDGMIDDSRDLFRATPNFNFTDTGLPEANLLNIRGIGSSSTFLSPSVTYYIDGVPVQQRAFDQRFLDTKRVEVLRGPQGTLWGQSSQAGAVSFVTENPTETVQGRIAGSLGNFDAYTLEGTLSGPIAEGVSGRINVQTHGRDGDIRNATFTSLTESVEEESLRETELLAANGKLRFETGEDTTITLSGRYVSDEQRPTTGLLVNGSDFPINSLNPIPLNELDSMGMALRVESDLGGSKFVSITGYESYDLLMEADITDGFIANASMGAPPFFVGMLNSLRVIEEDSIQWSQEARLQGESDSGSTWVVGFSALDSNFDSSTDVTSPALPNGKYAANIEKTNTAFFGEATILTSERTRFIAGARFNREKSDFSGAWSGRLPPAVDAFDEEGSVDEEFITGRLAASHDFSDELTGYATVARG
ncbi:MAG: TonB-dependent receptor [Verrucomicrobiota bacterium]